MVLLFGGDVIFFLDGGFKVGDVILLWEGDVVCFLLSGVGLSSPS